MIFIETPVFTADVKALLPDESYTELQLTLAAGPMTGDLIPGTGGLRKVRWALMLAIYGKGAKDDLTATEKRLLQRIVEQWS